MIIINCKKMRLFSFVFDLAKFFFFFLDSFFLIHFLIESESIFYGDSKNIIFIFEKKLPREILRVFGEKRVNFES
jgi:hypothetical protein